jgi:uncharacterized protein (TIGR00730 family)
MQRICVFCGSSPGSGPEYLRAAERFAQALVQRRLGLVYGGSGVGLMGKLADTVIAAGGEVIGVIPAALAEREVAHPNLPDLRIVGSMHERKAMMEELADGFISLPGGLGTIEEMLEMLTWAQLGIHRKPCGLLNVSGYFDRLLEFIDLAVSQRFIGSEHRSLLLASDNPDELLDRCAAYQPPAIDKAEWIFSLNPR